MPPKRLVVVPFCSRRPESDKQARVEPWTITMSIPRRTRSPRLQNDPPNMADGVRRLSRRFNNGELSAYRVGRTWRMTHEDVADLTKRQRNRSIARNGGRCCGRKSLACADVASAAGARRVVIDTAADRSHRA